MKTNITKSLLSAGLSAALLLTTNAHAVDSSQRGGKWEGYLRFNYLFGKDFDLNDTEADSDDSFGFGLGFGYNFDEHWAMEGYLGWSQVDYKAQIKPAAGNANKAFTVDGELETTNFQLNAAYYIFDSAITPYINGGVGATYVNTNIPDGPAVPVCWYDPWWGYYCGAAVPTKDETDYSYNVGAGVRWDVGESFYTRLQFTNQWIHVGGGTGTPDFASLGIDLGLMF